MEWVELIFYNGLNNLKRNKMKKFKIYYWRETGDDCIDCDKEIMCFGNDEILHFKLRMKIEKYLKISKKLNNKIKEL